AGQVRTIEQTGYRARADRRWMKGTIVEVDPINALCTMDVGATLPDGTPQLLHNVPYSKTNVPNANDVVPIIYSNSSPHSKRIAPGQIGGNTDGTLNNGGVTGFRVPADTAPNVGDIDFTDSSS